MELRPPARAVVILQPSARLQLSNSNTRDGTWTCSFCVSGGALWGILWRNFLASCSYCRTDDCLFLGGGQGGLGAPLSAWVCRPLLSAEGQCSSKALVCCQHTSREVHQLRAASGAITLTDGSCAHAAPPVVLRWLAAGLSPCRPCCPLGLAGEQLHSTLHKL